MHYEELCIDAGLESQIGGNSIAFGKAPHREADSHPISQSSRHAVRQAGRQTSRQRGPKNKVWLFFSCGLRLQTLGNP